MDTAFLASLDLNKGEIALYETVLKMGSLPVTELARVTNIKRTTTYSIARSLVEKGLLTEDVTRRPAVFSLAEPEQLLNQIQKERKQLDVKEESYKKIAAELSKVKAFSDYPVPTVRFIQDSKIEDFLRKNVGEWANSAIQSGEYSWWGFQDHTFVEHFGGWIEWYWERWDDRMDLKFLSNRATSEVEFARKNAHRTKRHIKFWGEAVDFYSSTWVVGEYVIMINTRNRPFYLVEIHDKLMAHDQREIYRNLWELIQ